MARPGARAPLVVVDLQQDCEAPGGIAGARKARRLRQLIISSGDIDPVVDMHGTEVAVEALGLNVSAGGARRPWFYNATGTPLSAIAATPTGSKDPFALRRAALAVLRIIVENRLALDLADLCQVAADGYINQIEAHPAIAEVIEF